MSFEMTTLPDESNLPVQIVNAISGIPKSFIPSSLKALDRLMSAAVDIPVAWLAQQKAKIESQTNAYSLVEGFIAKGAAEIAGADPLLLGRAVEILVRKSYRQQTNREKIAFATVDELRSKTESSNPPATQEAEAPLIEDDWLNVFERYAEDASSERMQKLWGRVLAGEVRTPGRYSLRTLRFLSEFSQIDALSFSNFCNSVFSEIAPAALAKPADENADERRLIYMESSGLIQGTSGLGLQFKQTFNVNGETSLREGDLVIVFRGEPNTKFVTTVVSLTPMGQELLSLLPDRDARAAARRVAQSMRSPQIKSAFLAGVNNEQITMPMEILWQDY